MDESINYTTSVSKLKYFPYKTSVELLSAYHTNEIQLGVDRGVARQWAMYNSNSPFLLKLISRILTFSPYAIILFLFVFYIFTNNWYWLVSTPLIYFAVDILNPGSFVRYGVLRNIFKAFIIYRF